MHMTKQQLKETLEYNKKGAVEAYALLQAGFIEYKPVLEAALKNIALCERALDLQSRLEEYDVR